MGQYKRKRRRSKTGGGGGGGRDLIETDFEGLDTDLIENEVSNEVLDEK